MDVFEHYGIDPETSHSEDELKHWGIKGMKWGVRRYQNKDGSLTAAGRKRYAQEVEALQAEKAKLEQRQKNINAQKRMQARTDKLRSDIDELKGKKKPEEKKEEPEKKPDETKPVVQKPVSSKPKKPSEMTKEELAEEIERMKLIQSYNSYYSQLHPPKVNKGKEYAEKFISDGLIPAATNAVKKVGEDWLTKVGKESLGLNTKEAKTELEKLKETYDKLKVTKDIQDLKTSLDPERAKLQKEYDKTKLQSDIDKLKNPKDDWKTKAEEVKNKIAYQKLSDEEFQKTLKEAERAKAQDTIDKVLKGEKLPEDDKKDEEKKDDE